LPANFLTEALMDIHKIASMIDIGLTLAEVTKEINAHAITVDEDSGTIDVYCFKPHTVKEIKVELKVARKI